MSAVLTPTKIAFEAWWRAQTRMGDPSRRPHLISEAFGAGYHAALEAHPARDARALPAADTITIGAIETSEGEARSFSEITRGREPLEGMLVLDLPLGSVS